MVTMILNHKAVNGSLTTLAVTFKPKQTPISIVTKTFGTAALIKDLCDLFCNAVDRCATIENVALQFVNMLPEL